MNHCHSNKYVLPRCCFDPNKTHHLGWHWALRIYFLAHIRTWRSITWPYTHWYGALTYSYFCKHQVQGRMYSVNNGFIFFLAYIYLYDQIEVKSSFMQTYKNRYWNEYPFQNPQILLFNSKLDVYVRNDTRLVEYRYIKLQVSQRIFYQTCLLEADFTLLPTQTYP